MPILEKSKPQPAAPLCVREIRVGVPRERVEELEHFYVGIVGLVP